MLSAKKITITDFLQKAEKVPVIDVRSPSEFLAGHIPSAINIPLFDDKERETVGIEYKKRVGQRRFLKVWR